MWLEGDHEPAPERLACGAESRAHLLRMMAVVVDDGDAARGLAHLEAAMDAFEALERRGAGGERNAELARRRDRGERVLRHVTAGRVHQSLAQLDTTSRDDEASLEPLDGQVSSAHFGVRGEPVGQVALAHARQ